MDAIRIGIVGAGPWAALHAAELARHPDVELVGVWARRHEAAEELANKHGALAFAELDDLTEAVDALDFCVPPDVQAPLATTAARRGRHLLLEKPIALDLAAGRELAAAVQEAGVRSQVMLTRRFHPSTRDFLARVAALGQVDAAQGSFVHDAFLGGPFATPWRLREGVLMDLGPHLLDLAEQCAGPIEWVQACRNDHDALSVTARHTGGAVGSWMMSGSSSGTNHHRILAFGRAGSAEFDSRTTDEPTAFATAFSEFAAAVRTGSPVVADVTRGLELQALLDAVLTSLDEGRGVAVGHRP